MATSLPFKSTDFLSNGALCLQEPGTLIVGWGKWARESSPPSGKLTFFAPDFFLTDARPWWIPEHSAEISTQTLLDALPAETAAPLSWQEPSRAEWDEAFENILRRFRETPLRKAVPVIFQRARREMDNALRASCLRNLLSVPGGVRPYGCWSNEEGMMGATPEVLLKQRGARQYDTMALAGTRPRAPGPTPEWTNEKEAREHQIVVKDIAEILGRFGKVKIGERHIVSLAVLEHLRTELWLEADQDYPLAKLVSELHPTPALGTYPRSEGWRWLAELPGATDRARFGAPFGVVYPDKRALLLVAIRNIQWRKGEISLGSGCGVVDGSENQKEWDELVLKRLSVRKMLGQA